MKPTSVGSGRKSGSSTSCTSFKLSKSTGRRRSASRTPSAFHANEGATGIRRLYLERLNLRHCYSFENRRKLFEIHSSFKFATVVTQSGKPTESFSCAFYLHDDQWLFGDRKNRPSLTYT